MKYCNENRDIEHLLQILLTKQSCNAPKDYILQFKRAVFTFLHQRVYDIFDQKLVHLNPFPSAMDKYYNDLKVNYTLDFLGERIDDGTAKCIATGTLDARTLTPRNILSKEIVDVKQHVVVNEKVIDKQSVPVSKAVVCFPHSYMCSRDSKMLFCTTCGNYLILKK